MPLTLEKIRLDGKLKAYREVFAAMVTVHLTIRSLDTFTMVNAARRQLDAVEDEHRKGLRS
jgi:hypothetical protein